MYAGLQAHAPTRRFAVSTDLNTLRLYARIDEGSGPAIVMLHGINSDGGDWQPVIDEIGPGYRFIAFDLLGFGQSPKPLDIEYSADEHALVIENTLVDMGVDDQFLLVGYSLGGDIALRYASTYPERLRRLFLLDAPFYLPAAELKLSATGLRYLYELGSKRLWDMLATSKKKDSFLYKLATGVGEKPLQEAFLSDDIPTHWEIMSKNLENTINKATWIDDLPKLSMPVVHAIGVRDAIVKVSQAPALVRLKPDLEIRKIGGLAADHMVLWNMPQRVAEEIVRDEVRELNVAWRGGNGAPMVLLHGTRNASTAWIPAAEILARSNDVVLVDLLGFGDSPAPPSLHYTLADHVAAVLGTVNTIWGQDAKVTYIGEGLGATIALGCAATVPDRSAGVVAFSPGILEPGGSRVRSGTAGSKEIDGRLVPLLRSVENTMLAPGSDELLAQVPAPVRFIVPSHDALTPSEFLKRVCTEREGFEFVEVVGERGLPYASPVEAVRGITPTDTEGIALAERAKPAPERTAADPFLKALGGVENTLLRTGLLNLVAAAFILALHPIPGDLLTVGFTLWVLVASLSAIVGAFTMKRKTTSARFSFVTTALPTLLMGLAGLAVAGLMFSDPDTAKRFFGAVIAAYAMARGAADIYMASSIRDAAKPRWLLYAGGLTGVITALAIVFGPNHGRGILRLSLAFYLGMTGASLLAYVISARRARRRLLRELLSAQLEEQ